MYIPPTKSFKHLVKSGPIKFFVNTSTVLLIPFFQTTFRIYFSFKSLKKNILLCIYFVLLLALQSLTKSIAPLLFISISIGYSTRSPIDYNSLKSYNICCTHIIAATNSVSVTDNATIFYIILLHDTCVPSKYTAHPLTLHLVTGQFAKSESDLLLILNLKVLSYPFHLLSGFRFYPRFFVLSTNFIIRCITFT